MDVDMKWLGKTDKVCTVELAKNERNVPITKKKNTGKGKFVRLKQRNAIRLNKLI